MNRREKRLWKQVIDEMWLGPCGGGGGAFDASDELLELSREAGVPRWAILGAVADNIGRNDREQFRTGLRPEFDPEVIKRDAQTKLTRIGYFREYETNREPQL